MLLLKGGIPQRRCMRIVQPGIFYWWLSDILVRQGINAKSGEAYL